MKKNKLPNIVVLLVLSMITIVFWISFSVYQTFSEEAENSISRDVLLPITPVLDEKTLDQIENRIYP